MWVPVGYTEAKAMFTVSVFGLSEGWMMEWECLLQELWLRQALLKKKKILNADERDKWVESWQEQQVLLKMVDQKLDNGKQTVEKPPEKKMRVPELSSYSEAEPLIPLSSSMKAVVQIYRLETKFTQTWIHSAGEAHRTNIQFRLSYEKIDHKNSSRKYLVARKYLLSPAATVPCERLFSVSGSVVEKTKSIHLNQCK